MDHKQALLLFTFLIAATFALPFQAHAFWFVDTETGVAAAGLNDVRIPGDTGTDISLTEDLDSAPNGFFRLRLGNTFAKRHTIFALYAPLTLYSHGELEKDLEFDEILFPKGEDVRVIYRFDSYRLTYRYDFYKTDRWEIGAGLTGKIRDAAISVDGHEFAESDNTGFVPLVNFRAQWLFATSWGALFEADALAAPQGRAEDAMLAFFHRFNEHVDARVGYRILEGGADNDSVYTFALIHYGLIGLTARF